MRLAIDDVGAGFSSLRHIVLTAPDVIKLDRSIVDRRQHRPGAHHAGPLPRRRSATAAACQVVAEGVETAAEAAALRALGVDYGQGWHFGRPGPPEALAAVPGYRSLHRAGNGRRFPLAETGQRGLRRR